tara:strand:+ start:340 stop:795 length:456 start_codon:yes stop_codon:yes gene_type:complete
MNKNTKNVMSGLAVAFAAAAIAGCSATANTNTTAAAANTTDLVHCAGVNVCKGHNDCGGASNACAGQASCKGSGFVVMPSKACGDVGGKVQDDWRGEVSKAELVHCTGVNVCKGHNDCSGADNSCAGQASCKGTGFVNMGAKACGDIGGKS